MLLFLVSIFANQLTNIVDTFRKKKLRHTHTYTHDQRFFSLHFFKWRKNDKTIEIYLTHIWNIRSTEWKIKPNQHSWILTEELISSHPTNLLFPHHHSILFSTIFWLWKAPSSFWRRFLSLSLSMWWSYWLMEWMVFEANAKIIKQT